MQNVETWSRDMVPQITSQQIGHVKIASLRLPCCQVEVNKRFYTDNP